MEKAGIANLFTALPAALLLGGIFIFAACTGGGGNNSDRNTNVRSVDIVSEDAESVKIGKKEHFIFTEPESEYAEFNVILRDAANNEIMVNDPQNIVWTLDGADTDCFYFLYSSSLSGSTGTCATVQFDFDPPYDTEAELKVSYKGLSKKVDLTVEN